MNDKDEDVLRETLAKAAHESWSGWMRYLFEHDETKYLPSGGLVIENELNSRWKRQMNTPYEELSEEEKESDRKEADRYLSIFRSFEEGEAGDS